ncbi:MAG: outer membrane lipoprotein-sorting protein, partial [Bacteroidales bacterium]|nr:outer membrane lipoprotein-sorting protein [Bacteroidales bacterium]
MNVLGLFLAASIIASGTITRAQDARKISDDASKAIEFSSLEMVSTLRINDGKGGVRIRQVANATRKFGGVTKTMIKFLAPPYVKGTTMLIYDYEDKDDDMWIFLPSLRKSRRIISSEKGKSFMGSEFSNADMSKPNLDDFNWKMYGSELVDSKDC